MLFGDVSNVGIFVEDQDVAGEEDGDLVRQFTGVSLTTTDLDHAGKTLSAQGARRAVGNVITAVEYSS